MAQDVFIEAERLQVMGSISSDRANITSDGVNGTLTSVGLVVTNLNSTNQFGGITGGGAGASCTTGGTISTATRVSKSVTGSAVTGVILGSGTQDGQELTVVNTAAAASSISFATAGSAAASSHCATDFVFSGARAAKFVWEATSALWYPVSY